MLNLKPQYFGSLMQKNQLIGIDLDAWKDWRQEKRMTEDQIVGWHHRLNEHELEQLGDDERQ